MNFPFPKKEQNNKEVNYHYGWPMSFILSGSKKSCVKQLLFCPCYFQTTDSRDFKFIDADHIVAMGSNCYLEHIKSDLMYNDLKKSMII